jgi:two-component sensor histidine kinase
VRLGTLSLRQRLYLLTAVALAPALVILLYNEVVTRRKREVEVHRTAMRIGELASLEIQRIIDGSEGVLRTLANAPSIRDFDAGLCAPFLADVKAQSPQFASIAVADAEGVVQCRPDAPATPLRVDESSYFREVMAHGDFVVGTYETSRISGEPSLPLAVPIRDRDGAFQGVLVAGLSLDWLNNSLAERQYPENDALTLADRNGVIIARHPFPERFVGTRIPEPYLHLVTAEGPGTIEVMSQDGTRRILGYRPAATAPDGGIYVSAGISYDAAMLPIYQATQRGVVIAGLGALIAFALAALTGNRLVRQPVNRMLATIDAWRAGDTTSRTGMSHDSGELSEVGAAIDGFMDEVVEGRSARQKAEEHRDMLARELEHRIKNILATVQAVASQTFRGEASGDALSVFSGRLSAMASAHQQLMATNWTSADLQETVVNTLQPFRREQFEIEGPPLRIGEKAALAFSMAVHELATNAAKYGALQNTDGCVRIKWTVSDDSLAWQWTEHEGPPVKRPSKTGFGTRMIERMLSSELEAKVELNYPRAGVECRIEAPLANLVAKEEGPRRRPVVEAA